MEPFKWMGYHAALSAKSEDNFPLIPKWHSELDAIKKSKGKASGCTAVNVRLNKAGEMRMSMPCSVCHRLLYASNIKKVFFSTSLGWANMSL